MHPLAYASGYDKRGASPYLIQRLILPARKTGIVFAKGVSQFLGEPFVRAIGFVALFVTSFAFSWISKPIRPTRTKKSSSSFTTIGR